jgi:hypothetical protein
MFTNSTAQGTLPGSASLWTNGFNTRGGGVSLKFIHLLS